MPPNLHGGRGKVIYQLDMPPAGPRGRGMGRQTLQEKTCICTRPHCGIFCCVCGYLGWGRIKHDCPEHPKTIFLIDINQCPQCRAYAMHMVEYN